MIGGRRPVALGLGVALLVQALAPASVLAAAPALPAGLLPIAVNDTGSVVHGRLRSVAAPGVLGNDLQLGGGFTAQLVSGVANGTLDLYADGSYTYRSDLAFVGTDQFRYKVNGGLLGLSNTATVTITVTNTAAVANPDGYSAVADVERSIAAPGVLANDDDANGDNLTIDIVSEPANGNLNERPDGSFRYTADAGFAGIDTFRYRVWDGAAWSNTATVSMTVTGPATPTPTAAPTPTPKPTASPTPIPTLPPLPTLPVPSLPIPSLPLPTPTPVATPRPTATPRPGTTPSPTPDPGATATPTPSPTGPGSSTRPTATPGATSEPSAGTVVPPGGGAGSGGGPNDPGPRSGPAGPGDPFTIPGTEPGSEVVVDGADVVFGSFEWAVPALALTVPGLLLILAILAQATFGLAFVPIARRWLGGDRRRRLPA